MTIIGRRTVLASGVAAIALSALAGAATAEIHDPAGTKWSVAPYDDNGTIGDFHPVAWEFHDRGLMNAGNLWAGLYKLPDWGPLRRDKGRSSLQVRQEDLTDRSARDYG